MRDAIRVQPYLSPELFRKLRAYAAAQSVTVSAVVAAALGEYLERNDADDALVLRRLDAVTHVIEQVRRDLDALGAGFGRFVQYSFISAPSTADAQILKRSEGLYGKFLAIVGEQLRAGVTFTGQVFPQRRAPRPAPAPLEKGGREGEGRQ
jgi:hypothetical protein